MHRDLMHRAVTVALGLALLAGVSSGAAVARAEAPPASEWPVERNAQVLGAREWHVGLWGFDGGATDWLQVGTLWLPWGLLSPNVHLKARLLQRGPWTLSTELSFFEVNLDHLEWWGKDDLQGRLYSLPLTVALDVRAHPRLLTGLSASYAPVLTTPEYDSGALEGAGAYDTLSASGHVSARVASHWWLVLEVDWVLYQGLVAVGDIHAQLDDSTTVTGSAEADIAPIDPGRGGAGTLSTVFRAGNFGFRVGLGYGNWVVPRFKAATPDPMPILLFDIFGRFGGPDRGGDPSEAVGAPTP